MCLTADTNEPECKQATLVRPLPWLLFLPALFLIRIARSMVSILSQLVGNEQIEASDMVSYLQMCRRKLRVLKYQGLRQIRIRKNEKQLAMLLHNERSNSNDGGMIQAIFSSFLPIFKHISDVLDNQEKYSKCSVSFNERKSKISFCSNFCFFLAVLAQWLGS